MSLLKIKSTSTIFVLVILTTTIAVHEISAAVFNIKNNCPYTVWAAAQPGGGRQLNNGQNWILNSDPNYQDRGQIWARTNCDFSNRSSSSTKKCNSGDCNGSLKCETTGDAPVTLAEYQFNTTTENSPDFLNLSLLNGFNVPIKFSPDGTSCSSNGPSCIGDVNGMCPTELRDVGGCLHPCTVFGNDQFCCTKSNCNSTEAYFKLFKDACPQAYSYALDNVTNTFTCPSGTNYTITFCP
ncbi:hypothetical protein ACFE04_009438 [Oxalis oulophora]